MGLTRTEVEKVSLLARLEFSPAELAHLTEQLGAIVDYMQLLAELDTTNVEPMAHPVDIANVFRADEVRASLPRDEALANAPKRDDQCYLVPAVLGE